MNDLSFEEIRIGEEFYFNKIISDDDMSEFRRITGDENPLHTDSEYAKSKGFKDKVVYGQLVQAYFSTLAGMYIPGKNSLILSVEVNFRKPAYLGEEIRVFGKVTNKISFGNIIELSVGIKNKEELLVDGRMKVSVKK